jgi:multimeric flavodoxin WrbA
VKICVLNGSPKGRDSVTLQYVRFLELAFPEHTFFIEDIGQRIHAIETQETEFAAVIASVSASDAVLFATPVYYMLVPAQLKRFIELVFARNARPAFAGKYAASITTSIHFFDHTANAYLYAIAEDLGMAFTGSFPAEMNDLLSVPVQEQLFLFGSDFFAAVANKPCIQQMYLPVHCPTSHYSPAQPPVPFENAGKKVVILTDAVSGSNLERMVTRAAACFGKTSVVLFVQDAGMKGGCLGCVRCAFDNTCVYKDGFCKFWKEQVLAADILILAGTVRDRYLSAEIKQVLDRSFFLGHVPCMAGKQFGYLIEGPFSQLATLHEVLTAFPAMQGANLAGIVTDEGGDSTAIDARIDALAERCIRLSVSGYIPPAMFPQIAGHKLFRDEIWGGMRAVFKADHRHYRQNGLYDFPQNNYLKRIRTSLFSLFLSLPPVRNEAIRNMKKHMIQPFERVFTGSPVLKREADLWEKRTVENK